MSDIESCKKSFQLINTVNQSRQYLGIPTYLAACCYLSIYLKPQKQYDVKTINYILVMPSGYGKGEILNILAQIPTINIINQKLPEKSFESQLGEKPSEFFQNKILTAADLIPLTKGMSRKQLEQFISFWVMLLSGGTYGRTGKEHLKDVRTGVFWGCAAEEFPSILKLMNSDTLIGRIIPIYWNFTKEQKQSILKSMRNTTPCPDLTGLFPALNKEDIAKKDVGFNLNADDEDKIDNLAFELEGNSDKIPATRAQNYIKQLLRVIALIEGHDEVTSEELTFYKEHIHSLHTNPSELRKKNTLLQSFKEAPNMRDKERIKALGWSRGWYFVLKQRLTSEGKI